MPVGTMFLNHAFEALTQSRHKHRARRNGVRVPTICLRVLFGRIGFFGLFLLRSIVCPKPYRGKAPKALLAHFSHGDHPVHGKKDTPRRRHLTNHPECRGDHNLQKGRFPFFMMLFRIGRDISTLKTMIN